MSNPSIAITPRPTKSPRRLARAGWFQERLKETLSSRNAHFRVLTDAAVDRHHHTLNLRASAMEREAQSYEKAKPIKGNGSPFSNKSRNQAKGKAQ